MRLHSLVLGFATLFLSATAAAAAATHAEIAAEAERLARKSNATVNKAPKWARGGFVYRVSTPDDAAILPALEEGLGGFARLTDGSVRQIPFIMGLIGHDHLGSWNWDGMWPYWNRITHRAGDWDTLRGFISRVDKDANVAVSYHLNITDVNIGLRDYPETAAFFAKLVETGSIYRRDMNPATSKRDQEPPYVPAKIPGPADPDGNDPVAIFALVNYKKFWDSGLARGMIDDFYKRLPAAPPLLYLDVLNLSGGNFSTGFPDGPLGGGEDSQLAGVLAITDHLRAKGTDIASEGLRPELGERATYVWLHGGGSSREDYSVIEGGYKPAVAALAWQHVVGNSGAFHLSPIASRPEGLKAVREHYAALSAGKPSAKRMPGLDTFHLAYAYDGGEAIGPEFDFMGTSDPFRGDWSHLVGNFYLTAIQELHHIGKGSVRTASFNRVGVLHPSALVITGDDGVATTIPVVDAMAASYPKWKLDSARKDGEVMLEGPLVARFTAPRAGTWRIACAFAPGHSGGALNLYVDGKHHQAALDVQVGKEPFAFTPVTLAAGEHEIALDAGPLYARWSDGTTALWATPYLRTGLRIVNGDVTYAVDYDRMWPDTWSGATRIHFFSWDGTKRTWTLPAEWAKRTTATLYPLDLKGRGKPVRLAVTKGTVAPTLLPQVPYVLLPE